MMCAQQGDTNVRTQFLGAIVLILPFLGCGSSAVQDNRQLEAVPGWEQRSFLEKVELFPYHMESEREQALRESLATLTLGLKKDEVALRMPDPDYKDKQSHTQRGELEQTKWHYLLEQDCMECPGKTISLVFDARNNLRFGMNADQQPITFPRPVRAESD